jgi:hypothetical protein
MGDVNGAGEALLEALGHHRHVHNAGCSCHALETTSWFLAASGRRQDARTIRDAAREFRREVQAPTVPYEAFIGTHLDRYAAELNSVVPPVERPSNLAIALELAARLVTDSKTTFTAD